MHRKYILLFFFFCWRASESSSWTTNLNLAGTQLLQPSLPWLLGPCRQTLTLQQQLGWFAGMGSCSADLLEWGRVLLICWNGVMSWSHSNSWPLANVLELNLQCTSCCELLCFQFRFSAIVLHFVCAYRTQQSSFSICNNIAVWYALQFHHQGLLYWFVIL
jgi:hypothetical protein